nr:hypothetical protein [Tanacetum cinerariifolium]
AKVEGYTEVIVHDFKKRFETIFRRQVNRVHTLDFDGLTPNMRQDLDERLRMVYTGDDGQEDLDERLRMVYTGDDGQELGGARRSMTWRQFILALGLQLPRRWQRTNLVHTG